MSINAFVFEESGAVTVDWVVLTSALVALGVATLAVVSGGVGEVSNETSTHLASVETGIDSYAFTQTTVDWGAYASVANSHAQGVWGPDAEGRHWAENTYDSWSQLDDSTITSMYNDHYATAITGNTGSEYHRQRADYLAVSQQIMDERGIDRPSGNMSADEVRVLYE